MDASANSAPPDGLAGRTAKAGIWIIAGKLVGRGIDLITLLVLARLLSPADFGLVAMAMTAVLVAEAVLELPLVQALVRIPKPTGPMFDTAFTLSILRGIVLAAILSAVAWPLSLFYQEPRLPPLICALALAPVLRGLISPRMVLFMQKMDFRREFAIEVTGKVVALLVASTIAFSTGSYWAIAAGTIATPLAMNVLSYAFAPYSPRLTLSEWPRFANMVSWNSVSQLLSAFSWQMDRIVLGRFVPQATLGRYVLAGDLTAVAVQALVVPLARPLLAAFASRSNGDARVLGSSYSKASNAVVFLAAPVLLSMALLAEPLVRIILGNRWLETAPLLHWLALITLLALPVTPVPAAAMALDRTRMIAVRTAIEATIKMPTMLIGVFTLGVNGALLAHAISTLVVSAVSMKFIQDLIGLPIRRQIAALWRTLVGLGGMAACLLLVRPLIAADELISVLTFQTAAAVIGAGAVYLSLVFSLWRWSGSPEGIEAIIVRSLHRVLRHR